MRFPDENLRFTVRLEVASLPRNLLILSLLHVDSSCHDSLVQIGAGVKLHSIQSAKVFKEPSRGIPRIHYNLRINTSGGAYDVVLLGAHPTPIPLLLVWKRDKCPSPHMHVMRTPLLEMQYCCLWRQEPVKARIQHLAAT